MIINYTSKRSYRPDVLGPNLVSNPGPFNNTTGWTAGNSSTLSAVSGRLRVARNAVNSPYATQTITVDENELYLLESSHTFATSDNVGYEVSDGAGGYSGFLYNSSFVSSGSVKKYLLTKTTSLVVNLIAYSTAGAVYGEFYSIQLRKVSSLGHAGTQLLSADFSSSTTNSVDPWGASNSTLSSTSTKLRVTNSGAIAGSAYNYVPTVHGKAYTVSVLYTKGTATSAICYVYEYLANGLLTSFSMTTTGTKYTGSFTATGTTTVIILQNSAELNAYNDYSSITVTQADSGYTLEKDIVSESDERPSVGGWRQISIGGNSESNYGRKDKIHTVTTMAILSRSEADDWKEFFDSHAGGETFTIDLYQDPRPELITNGTFDSATTGYISGNGSALSIVSRKLKVLNGIASYGDGRTTIPTTVGNQYTLYIDVELVSSSLCFVYVSSSAGGSDIAGLSMSASKTWNVTFIALSTTTHIALANGTNTSGHYNYFDNVSVKSIATDNIVSAILEGDGKVERISQHIYQATFSYRVI